MQLGELPVEESGRKTAESEVRRDAILIGEEALRRHLGAFEGGDPRLPLQMPVEARQRHRLTSEVSRRRTRLDVEVWGTRAEVVVWGEEEDYQKSFIRISQLHA